MNGLVTLRSAHAFAETLQRLAGALKRRNLTIFATVDHAAGAAEASLALRPTTLVLFGNPKGGTPLMQKAQTAGIDLPLKALVWQDADGAVWFTTNDMGWLAQRHGLEGVEALGALEALLRSSGEAATGN